tara:strand:- start:1244 stop:1369 length:126 start_codon:yes stop_codon:yes gene_type:complete
MNIRNSLGLFISKPCRDLLLIARKESVVEKKESRRNKEMKK